MRKNYYIILLTLKICVTAKGCTKNSRWLSNTIRHTKKLCNVCFAVIEMQFRCRSLQCIEDFLLETFGEMFHRRHHEGGPEKNIQKGKCLGDNIQRSNTIPMHMSDLFLHQKPSIIVVRDRLLGKTLLDGTHGQTAKKSFILYFSIRQST